MNVLLTRSVELEARLLDFFEVKPPQNSGRLSSSRVLLSVAFEHAESLKSLIAMGNCTSATGLLRLQYEAVVRAMWVSYAASEGAAAALSAALTNESARKASNKLPMLSGMLIELDGKAPKEAMDLLYDFQQHQWKPLSSYVHGGIHAITRHSAGYPKPLLANIIKTSNAVSIMAGMMLVILAADPVQQGKLPALQIEFADCLLDLKA